MTAEKFGGKEVLSFAIRL